MKKETMENKNLETLVNAINKAIISRKKENREMGWDYNVVGAVLYSLPEQPEKFEILTILAKKDIQAYPQKARTIEHMAHMIGEGLDPLPDTPDSEGFYQDIFKNIPRNYRRKITLYPAEQINLSSEELKNNLNGLEDITIRIISPYDYVKQTLKEYCE